MRKLIAACAVVVSCLSSAVSCAEDGPWFTDMDRAQQVARAEGKDIFMFYTGSDWCAWCIRLKKEVLDQPAFMDYAARNLVLVELDFPKKTALLSEAQAAHNRVWLERFPPAGYPTVFLTDAALNRYAKTGYRPGGAERYVEHLKGLKEVPGQVRAVLAEAERASGIERAKRLDRALGIDGAILDTRALQAQIVSLLTADAEVEALRAKYVPVTAPIKGDKELREEMVGLMKQDSKPEAKVTGLIGLIGKYGDVKSGDSINEAVNSLARLAMSSGQQATAIPVIEALFSNPQYPSQLRENFGVAKAALLASTGDRAAAAAQIDAVMKVVPEKEGSGLREALMENIENVAAEAKR